MTVFSAAKAAKKQNKAIKKQQKLIAEQKELTAEQQAKLQAAAAIQIKNLGKQFDIKKIQVAHEAEQIAGRIAVSSAERGVGTGGTFEALMRQTAFDKAFNKMILDESFKAQRHSIEAGAEAGVFNLDAMIHGLSQQSIAAGAMKQNPLLAGFSNFLGLAGTGLSIAGGIHALTRPSPGSYSIPHGIKMP